MVILVKDLRVGMLVKLTSKQSRNSYTAKVQNIRPGHLNDSITFQLLDLGRSQTLTSGELSRLWIIETTGNNSMVPEGLGVKVGQIYVCTDVIGRYYDWKGKKVIIKSYKYGSFGIALLSNPGDIKTFKQGQISLETLKGQEVDLVLENSAAGLVDRIKNALHIGGVSNVITGGEETN